MLKKKLLVIGNPNSAFIMQFIENIIKSTKEYEIYILSLVEAVNFLDFYAKNQITIVVNVRPKGTRLWRFLLATAHKIRRINKDFDYIHVHCVDRVLLSLAKTLSRNRAKIIVSYWGSDIYRKEEKAFSNEGPYLDGVSHITFINGEMQEIFESHYGLKYQEKCQLLDFGNGCMENMLSVNLKYKEGLIEYAKSVFGFPDDKVIVGVGYNGAVIQQHAEVLNEIKKLPLDIRSQMFLFLHMGYGVIDEEREERIKDILEDMQCEYLISKEFMTGERLALLRYAVDIYVNGEKTDAMSATILEYLYGGKVVVNPLWLQYNFLKENNLKDVKYNNFTDLSKVLEKVFSEELVTEKEKTCNRETLYKLCSWNSVIDKWLALYD